MVNRAELYDLLSHTQANIAYYRAKLTAMEETIATCTANLQKSNNDPDALNNQLELKTFELRLASLGAWVGRWKDTEKRVKEAIKRVEYEAAVEAGLWC